MQVVPVHYIPRSGSSYSILVTAPVSWERGVVQANENTMLRVELKPTLLLFQPSILTIRQPRLPDAIHLPMGHFTWRGEVPNYTLNRSDRWAMVWMLKDHYQRWYKCNGNLWVSDGFIILFLLMRHGSVFTCSRYNCRKPRRPTHIISAQSTPNNYNDQLRKHTHLCAQRSLTQTLSMYRQIWAVTAF